MAKSEKMIQLKTGATRSDNSTKPDYRGFISPLAIMMFGEYMLRHQIQADGKPRASDNWKKGLPIERYVESKVRHDVAFWRLWEALLKDPTNEALRLELEEEISACYFNVQGFMHEWMRAKTPLPR